MNNHIHEQVKDRQLGLELEEFARRATPPDRLHNILTGRRSTREDRGAEDARDDAIASDPVGRLRWMSAVAVAVSLGIVVGVAWLAQPVSQEKGDRPLPGATAGNHDQDPGQNRDNQNKASPQGRTLPPPFLVQSLDEIRRLPKNSRNVRGIGLGSVELQALAAIRGLERLDLTRVGQDKPLADEDIQHLAGLSKLRELVLNQQSGITGAGVASLANLPILESLSLRGVRISKTAMATLAKKLSALRKLDLEFSTMTDEILRVVVRIRGLNWLSLRGCSRLTPRGLASLQSLDQLEHLDIGQLDSSSGVISNRAINLPAADWHKSHNRFKGVVDDLIRHLPSSLRSLGLTESWSLTDKGLALISTQCPRLTGIDVSGCTKMTDAGLTKLLGRLELRRLDISRTLCTERVLESLLAETTLEELKAPLRWVTSDIAVQLKALPRMRRLETESRRRHTDLEASIRDINAGNRNTRAVNRVIEDLRTRIQSTSKRKRPPE